MSRDNHICMDREWKLARILSERESFILSCHSYCDVIATIPSILGRASTGATRHNHHLALRTILAKFLVFVVGDKAKTLAKIPSQCHVHRWRHKRGPSERHHGVNHVDARSFRKQQFGWSDIDFWSTRGISPFWERIERDMARYVDSALRPLPLSCWERTLFLHCTSCILEALKPRRVLHVLVRGLIG